MYKMKVNCQRERERERFVPIGVSAALCLVRTIVGGIISLMQDYMRSHCNSTFSYVKLSTCTERKRLL